MIEELFKKLLGPLILAFLLALGLWVWLLSLDLPASRDVAAAPLELRLLSSPVTKTLSPSMDATLIQTSTGGLSNGGDTRFFAGRTGQPSNSIRRGLIAFDLGEIPAGSTVISVALTLFAMNIPPDDPIISQTITLHRLSANWGEGTVVGGGAGGDAQPGDATWLHRFYSTTQWINPGGDFNPTSSATNNEVGGIGLYTWSSPQMVTDVQGWLDAPSTNFGWLLRGNESTGRTARGFSSKEDTIPAFRPILRVTYLAPALVDLILSKRVSDPTPLPGTLITYTLVVTNSGGLTATNAHISDTLPAGISFVGPVNIMPPGAGMPGNAGTLPTLASNLTIGANSWVTVTFPVSVGQNILPGTTLTNTAAITSTELSTPVTAAVSLKIDPYVFYLPIIKKEG